LAFLPRSVLGVILVLLVTAAVSCSSQKAGRFDYLRVTVDGQQALGISAKDAMIRGVVIFFHDAGTNEFSITSDQAHRDLTTKLVDAGFAVVSSNAGGDAFGNDASQMNYVYLGGTAVDHYHVENVFFLAESMGAIAATNLLARNLTPRVRGFAAVNPMFDLGAVAPQYRSTIAESYPTQSMDSVNPMNIPLDAMRNKNIRLYVSPEDSLVGADANAIAFQRRFGSAADVSVVQCSGQHRDRSCFQGDDIVKWFAEMEKRPEHS
jgi:pimeloyl-ACP methyl ester carboxylesterase